MLKRIMLSLFFFRIQKLDQSLKKTHRLFRRIVYLNFELLVNEQHLHLCDIAILHRKNALNYKKACFCSSTFSASKMHKM